MAAFDVLTDYCVFLEEWIEPNKKKLAELDPNDWKLKDGKWQKNAELRDYINSIREQLQDNDEKEIAFVLQEAV